MYLFLQCNSSTYDLSIADEIISQLARRGLLTLRVALRLTGA
jgi:hypothetical protein